MRILRVVIFLGLLLSSIEKASVEDVKAHFDTYSTAFKWRGKNKDTLKIFMVPHSHDDVGWLATQEDYFVEGYAPRDQSAVKDIIDSVVEVLLKTQG